jgi:hypothetical protein
MKKVNKKTSLEMQSDCGKSIEYTALNFNSKHKFASNLVLEYFYHNRLRSMDFFDFQYNRMRFKFSFMI